MSALESDTPSASTRPYLIRALYEWCADNGWTPHIAVLADPTVQVPREYVRDGQIILNISADATSGLTLDNDYVRFRARFGGVPREIIIPVDRVMAIYARENGQGMAFPMLEPETETSGDADAAPGADVVSAGLTLAGQGPLAKDDSPAPGGPRGGIRLVSTTPAASDGGAGDEPPPPTPTPPPRPALKRVK